MLMLKRRRTICNAVYDLAGLGFEPEVRALTVFKITGIKVLAYLIFCYATFTVNGFDHRKRNLTFAKTDF